MFKITNIFLGIFSLYVVVLATPITFVYNSTTDASMVGASNEIAVLAEFTFDSDLLNGTGSFVTSPTNGSYGPWNGFLQIGSERVELTGGTIEVFNNAGTTIKSDGYDFRWDSHRGNSSGTFFGSGLGFFRILIVDDDLTMLSSVELPTNPIFSIQGDYIQDDYSLLSSGPFPPLNTFGLSEFSDSQLKREFSLTLKETQVPEPSSLLLLFFGITSLGLCAYKKHKTI